MTGDDERAIAVLERLGADETLGCPFRRLEITSNQPDMYSWDNEGPNGPRLVVVPLRLWAARCKTPEVYQVLNYWERKGSLLAPSTWTQAIALHSAGWNRGITLPHATHERGDYCERCHDRAELPQAWSREDAEARADG